MLSDDVQLISVNDHIVEPANLFEGRLPARWVEEAPAVIEQPGVVAWRLGAEVSIAVSTSLQEGEPPADEAVARVERMWAAAGEPEARLAAMDADRIAAQALFPHAMGFAGDKLRFLGGELWGLCAAAYNDFVLCQYCVPDRQRLLGIGILPLADPRAAAAEVERIAALGGRGVSFPHNPFQLGLPSLYDEYWAPVFDALNSARLPLFMHIGTGTPLVTGPGAPFEVLLSLATLDALTAMTDLAFSPVLPGRPELRVVLVEAGLDPGHDRAHRLFLGPSGGHRRGTGATVATTAAPGPRRLHRRPGRDEPARRRRRRTGVVDERLSPSRLGLARQPGPPGPSAQGRG
jgi:predicted TIM-barrel fold metal-dependent hydrolase